MENDAEYEHSNLTNMRTFSGRSLIMAHQDCGRDGKYARDADVRLGSTDNETKKFINNKFPRFKFVATCINFNSNLFDTNPLFGFMI